MNLTRARRAAALLLTAAAAATGASAAAPAPPPPRLAVIVVSDGLSWQRLSTYRPWFTAGFKRLLDEGTVFTAANYAHINTETAPGHASLGTGAPPRVHGIVTNRWFEPTADGAMRVVYCTDQAAPPSPGSPPLFYREVPREGRIYVFALSSRLLAFESGGAFTPVITKPGYGPGGETILFDSDDALFLYNFRHDLPGQPLRTGLMPGPVNLRVPTLGDRLVAASPDSRVVAISGKDRGAIFLAGANPNHAVYWFDHGNGSFTSSAAYDASSPFTAQVRKLVTTFGRTRAGSLLPQRFGTTWRKLPAPADAEALPQPVPATSLFEFQLPDNGLFFDHDLLFNRAGYFQAVYGSPFIDELVADLAVTLLRNADLALGRHTASDLLALSFSAQDLVSHRFGPESEENLDTLRRLDVQLGRVLDTLDDTVGRGNWVLAFSADHGFATIPEMDKRRDPSFRGGRLVGGERVLVGDDDRLNRLLAEELCLDPASKPIVGVEGFNLTYDRAHLPLRTVAGPCGPAGRMVGASEIDEVLPRVATKYFRETIADVLLVSRHATWDDAEPGVSFARNDLDLARSGDAIIIPRPGVLMHWDPIRGTGHGSQYPCDTHVPLVFVGGPFRPGTNTEPVTPYDLAPTLAKLLGVALPDATGRALTPAPAAPQHGGRQR